MGKVALNATTIFEEINEISIGIQLSLWSEWSTCSKFCGSGEMTRSRSCLTGCEFSTDDLTQTQACNDQQCPGKKNLKGASLFSIYLRFRIIITYIYRSISVHFAQIISI